MYLRGFMTERSQFVKRLKIFRHRKNYSNIVDVCLPTCPALSGIHPCARGSGSATKGPPPPRAEHGLCQARIGKAGRLPNYFADGDLVRHRCQAKDAYAAMTRLKGALKQVPWASPA
jgi:hypothetical protein